MNHCTSATNHLLECFFCFAYVFSHSVCQFAIPAFIFPLIRFVVAYHLLFFFIRHFFFMLFIHSFIHFLFLSSSFKGISFRFLFCFTSFFHYESEWCIMHKILLIFVFFSKHICSMRIAASVAIKHWAYWILIFFLFFRCYFISLFRFEMECALTLVWNWNVIERFCFCVLLTH